MDRLQGKINRKKFKVSPTLEEIDFCIKVLGVKETQFEDIYGIPRDTIKRMRYNGRQLPAKYWHFPKAILWVYDGEPV